MFLFQFIIIVTVYHASYSYAFCPHKCTCAKRYLTIRVKNCQSSLKHTLENLPINTTALYLTLGNIKRIATNDFQLLTNLQFLSISAKNLTDIDDYAFSYLKKLKSLRISGSKIVSVKNHLLSGLSALETLKLERNKHLKTVHQDVFQEVKHTLRRIFLVHCGIKVIQNSTFFSLHKLKSLYLHSNQLISFQSGTFSALSSLELLNLYDNEIEYLNKRTFYGLKSLELLSLRRNKIRSIDTDLFSPVHNLLSLDLKDNKIESISNCTFFNLSKLNSLYLENNIISEIKENTFIGLSNLETLNLNNNKLRNIKYLFTIDISMITCQVSKYKVDFLSSHYNCEVCHFKKLEKLYINKNNISLIENTTFFGLSQLQELKLERNQISSIDYNSFKDLTKLQVLHLEYNQLTYIDRALFYDLTNLKKLYLSSNYLNYLEEGLFATNLQLTYLHLRNNQLRHFNDSIFAARSINPRYTDSRSISPRYTDYSETDSVNESKTEVSTGETMNSQIEQTKITDTPINAERVDVPRINEKKNFISFHSLDLNSNQLTSIPALDLQRFPNLVNMYLRNNSISTLKFKQLQKLQNVRVDLSNNHLKCSCYFKDILNSIQRLSIKTTCQQKGEIKNIFDLDCTKLRTGWNEIGNFSSYQIDFLENRSLFKTLPEQFQIQIEIVEIQNDSEFCSPFMFNISLGYELELSKFSGFNVIKIWRNSILIKETFVPINITQMRHVVQLSQQQDISLDFYFTISFNDWLIYNVFESQIEISRQNSYGPINDTQCFRTARFYLKTKPVIIHNSCVETTYVNGEYGCNTNSRLQLFVYVFELLFIVITLQYVI